MLRTIMDHAGRCGCTGARDALGDVMSSNLDAEPLPILLDVVVLLAERPEAAIGRGSVGTVVDELDGDNLLVEFADNEGRAYAIAPCRTSELLVLRFVPVAA